MPDPIRVTRKITLEDQCRALTKALRRRKPVLRLTPGHVRAIQKRQGRA